MFSSAKKLSPARASPRACLHVSRAERLDRRVFLTSLVGSGVFVGQATAGGSEFVDDRSLALLSRKGSYALTDDEWRAKLSPAQFKVLRQEGTELPFSSSLNKEKRPGTFKCAGCAQPIFAMSTKFDSGTGWPSFYAPLPGAITELPDYSIFFMPRTEVRCSRCASHLGHVFNDAPQTPTGLRYCMNGVAMTFEPSSA